MKGNFQAPKGMPDRLPAQVSLRDWAQAKILETYRRFGFERVETPALQRIELLKNGNGGENEKLIFEVLKRGEKFELNAETRKEDLVDMGLRFDLTVPLVRYYSANRALLPSPFKSIQIAPVWRAERPQQGRLRQFTQCDIDVIGMESPYAEIELTLATAQALLSLGLSNFTVRINDRRLLEALCLDAGFGLDVLPSVFITLDKLDKVGLAGIRAEFSAKGLDQEAVNKLLAVVEPLSASPLEFQQVCSLLGENMPKALLDQLFAIASAVEGQAQGRYRVVFDPTLVRGMGYYTGPIFEITADGTTAAIAGGGRYDHLIGKVSSNPSPACGFSIGFERIMDMLERQGIKPLQSNAKVALLYEAGAVPPKDVAQAAQTLRQSGKDVSVLPRKKEMRKQLDALLAQGFSAFAVVPPAGAELIVKELQAS